MEAYNPSKIEQKWRKKWDSARLYQARDLSKKPKYYVLDMFPYPSGSAMHVGHCKGYIASDIFARMKMMQGFNVLHPMGWDAFGLPAENFAIKNKMHPSRAVKQNIGQFKAQLEKIGFTYDWSREINTTDPNYYRWTQWQFKKMFEAGLVKSIMEPVNYCPTCKTVLANEDVEEGKCERCSASVERKPIREWEILITKYADRLLNDLGKLDWEPSILEMQKNWIGKSEGAEVKFKIQNSKGKIEIQNSKFITIFTTRIDTIFGCTYCVVAPEHKIIDELRANIENWSEVEAYIKAAKQKTDLERTDLAKEKTGMELKGIKAVNPFNNRELPVFVGDYVVGHYGTGAIMAVPAHDERDFGFAQKHNLEITEVIKGGQVLPFVEDGVLANSGEFNGLPSARARQQMAEYAEKNNFGRRAAHYKMRDWVFARQRYWGEPIPLVYCKNCADKIKSGKYAENEFTRGELENPGWIAVSDKDLPVKLPDVKSYEPAGDGRSPLANVKNFVETKCPKCGGNAERETNTMPQWAGSCWYYLRYIDPQNNKTFVDLEKEKYWSPVDLYIGGAEHATRHLLYARFWHKFLFDNKWANYDEPFQKFQHVGLILGQDGQKMSKRWNNVVNPDDMIEKYGADALRIYEMFMGPFGDAIAWNTNGVMGAKRFLDKLWNLQGKIGTISEETEKTLHQTIKKVSEDIYDLKFNTAISQMMIFVNFAAEAGLSRGQYLEFIKLLSAFAPHIAEEIWQKYNKKIFGFESVFQQKWPEYDKGKIKEGMIEIPVQVNGKLKGKIKISADANQDEAQSAALRNGAVQKAMAGAPARKVIYVKGKMLNIVI